MSRPALPGAWGKDYLAAFARGAATTRKAELDHQSEREEWLSVAQQEFKQREIERETE